MCYSLLLVEYFAHIPLLYFFPSSFCNSAGNFKQTNNFVWGQTAFGFSIGEPLIKQQQTEAVVPISNTNQYALVLGGPHSPASSTK